MTLYMKDRLKNIDRNKVLKMNFKGPKEAVSKNVLKVMF